MEITHQKRNLPKSSPEGEGFIPPRKRNKNVLKFLTLFVFLVTQNAYSTLLTKVYAEDNDEVRDIKVKMSSWVKESLKKRTGQYGGQINNEEREYIVENILKSYIQNPYPKIDESKITQCEDLPDFGTIYSSYGISISWKNLNLMNLEDKLMYFDTFIERQTNFFIDSMKKYRDYPSSFTGKIGFVQHKEVDENAHNLVKLIIYKIKYINYLKKQQTENEKKQLSLIQQEKVKEEKDIERKFLDDYISDENRNTITSKKVQTEPTEEILIIKGLKEKNDLFTSENEKLRKQIGEGQNKFLSILNKNKSLEEEINELKLMLKIAQKK